MFLDWDEVLRYREKAVATISGEKGLEADAVSRRLRVEVDDLIDDRFRVSFVDKDIGTCVVVYLDGDPG